MSIEVLPSGSIVVEGPQDMALMRLLSLQSALSLEAKGLRLSRGFSALKVAKRDYGCRGNRANVMGQIDAMVAAAKAARG